MTITALPIPPSRQDPTNFSERADAFMAALPTFATETNATAVDVDADAVSAAASAVNAAASAAGANASANVSKWVSGTTYAQGDVEWSPINFFSYRRKIAGAGTTDPSADPTNWALVSGAGDVSLTGIQTLTNKTLVAPVLGTPASGDLANCTFPASVATTTQVNLKANIASPTFTGVPAAPTPATGTSTTQLATTAFVNAEILADVGVANSALVKTALNASGTAPVYACRVWVNFNGTGTPSIRGSGNVSSITDNGVGSYTINFTTALPDVNYCVTATGARPVVTNYDGIVQAYPVSASAVDIKCSNGAANLEDFDRIFVAIFR